MTGSRAPVDLLVIDAVAGRHDGYRGLLGSFVRKVVTVAPGDAARQQLLSGAFAAVIVHLDDDAADVLADIADVDEASGPPVVVVSAQMPDLRAFGAHGRVTEFVPSAHATELLPPKVSCLVELAKVKGELDEERRTSDALRRRMGEQIHRGKNLLAILQSVARRTMHEGRAMSDAREALMGRLGTLARAYQLVTASNGAGTDIADVVEAELAHVMDRVTVSGPPVRLSGSVVQTFALAIHELAANASKHGALLSPKGAVAVGWTFFEYGADRYLEVAWSERGGTTPKAPAEFGFGLTLVSSFAGAHAQTPNLLFEGEGFACRMRLSQDVLVPS